MEFARARARVCVCVCLCVCVRASERERERERENFGCFFFLFSYLFSLTFTLSTGHTLWRMNFTKVKINLDHLNEWIIFIWFALTLIAKLGQTAQRPLGWSLHRLALSMWVKQSHITGHLCVLRLRSTVRLSHTIRSVTTGTQWSRPMKPRIVFEFLFSRTTDTDRVRAFS